MRARWLLVFWLSVALGDDAWSHEPAVEEPVGLFATGFAGPEGLAFTDDGGLIVGTTTGDLYRVTRIGTSSLLASVGDALAGITVLRDGRILAASVSADRVWSITPDGTATVFASGIGGPNFIVQTRRTGRILASASFAGTIVDITDGTPTVAASGLVFPNGLAISRARGSRFLYVAETFMSRVSRLPLDRDDNLGAPEVYANGLPLADGLAFDKGRNLLVESVRTRALCKTGHRSG